MSARKILEEAEIKRLYLSGTKRKEIAVMFGVSCKPIQRVLSGLSGRKPNYRKRLEPVTKEFIIRNVSLDDNGCWLWNHACSPSGYAVISTPEKPYCRGSRLVWKLWHGDDPGAMCVCHSCDNRRCLNPDHLFLGTNKDNMQDAVRKGRIASGIRQGTYTKPECRKKGELNGQSKLTEIQVLEIRQRRSNGELLRVLAKDYGVAMTQISQVANRKKWAHVQ